MSNFLLEPAHPFSYHIFSMSFGRPIDLPLDEHNLVTSVMNYSDLPAKTFPLTDSYVSHNNNDDEVDSPAQLRWDIDPDCANSETEIHFRCRIGGLPQTAIPPLHIMRGLEKGKVVPAHCLCAPPGQDDALALQEYGRDFNILFVPFIAIRNRGQYMRVILTREVGVLLEDRSTIVVLRAGTNSVEQWLALYTEIQATRGRPTTTIKRILGPCLSCGLKWINEMSVTRTSLYLLVLSS